MCLEPPQIKSRMGFVTETSYSQNAEYAVPAGERQMANRFHSQLSGNWNVRQFLSAGDDRFSRSQNLPHESFIALKPFVNHVVAAFRKVERVDPQPAVRRIRQQNAN